MQLQQVLFLIYLPLLYPVTGEITYPLDTLQGASHIGKPLGSSNWSLRAEAVLGDQHKVCETIHQHKCVFM
jgi:hypothetical protein